MRDRKGHSGESLLAPRAGSRRQGALAGLFADRRAGAAFEFALLVPMLMTMMLGTVQYATLYYSYSAMLGAARTATRAVAIGSQTATAAEATARTTLPNWVPSGNYTVSITDGAAGSQVITQITAPSSKAALMPYLPMPANVVARVVMIKEG
jgi:Flp pilus assembly protein TadG